jgi:uroporphyrinogen-III synthase
MKKLFISRDLDEDQAFVKRMLEADIEVHGQSLVEFSKVPFSKVPDSDWIFFYSKQGIRFYFDGLDDPAYWSGVRMGMPLKVKQLKYATFGKGSTAFLKSYRNITADFTGSGKAEQTATAFLAKAKGEKVLFVRGKQSQQSVQELLKGADLEMMDLVVYDNQPLQKFTVPQCHYLLFTSPLNATAYYQKYSKKPAQKVFAIGETTADTLVSLGLKEVVVAAQPSLDDLATLVLESIT